MTLAYGEGNQLAAPVLSASGREEPPCDVTLQSRSLVTQMGAERLWGRRILAAIPSKAGD